MAESENNDREQKIVTAASELFAYYGFDKTTVSDIANAAGISKGAVYLHFDSKDDLFEAVMVREMMAYSEKWFALIDADPDGGTIGAMYKNSLYALNENDFVGAMFKRDKRVFGSYLHKPDNLFRSLRDRQEPSFRQLFVQQMQEAGAMRRDIEPQVVAHIMDMLAYGLVAIDDVLPNNQAPPVDAVIEGIAEIMDRALTPPGGDNSDAGKRIIRQIAEATRRQFETQQESRESGKQE